MAFCRNCGSQLAEEEVKCPNCGYDETGAAGTVEELQGPVKAKTGLMVAMWIFCLLGGLLGIILASSVIGAKNPDKTHKYIEQSRTQAKIALGVAIAVTILYLAMNASA